LVRKGERQPVELAKFAREPWKLRCRRLLW
jgi:hypothetical protein